MIALSVTWDAIQIMVIIIEPFTLSTYCGMVRGVLLLAAAVRLNKMNQKNSGQIPYLNK